MGICLSEDLVERYKAGTCSWDERQAVQEHSTHCEACRRRVGAVRATIAIEDDSDQGTTNRRASDVPTEEIRLGEDQRATQSLAETVTGAAETGGVGKAAGPGFEGYEVFERIGEGGLGTVWRALQLSTQRQVALKVLGSGTFGTEKARMRFEREVELTARLEHPNIARIYDSGLQRGMYYYTMELFEGEHLDIYIRERQLTQRQILELIHTICQAVQYAHQRGVIHRDLKPPNIIVSEDGQPHILDFGLAKTLVETDKSRVVSLDGDIVGTPAFMSPEQAAGHPDAIDTRTDVYSLGVILFNLLTKEWPYELIGSRYEILTTIQQHEPTRPRRLVQHFDTDLEAILLKALAKDPHARYQSVAELANDIQYWLRGLPITARSVSSIYLLKKLIVRHRTASAIAALVLVILVSTSFISLYAARQAIAASAASRASTEAYKKIAKERLPVGNRVLFMLILELWHDGKMARARAYPVHLDHGSPERTAARFLLDPRPFEEKQAAFREEFSAHLPSFWEFVVGEYHLKNENKPAAIEAYNRCLAIEDDDSELDDWFRNRAMRKLDELIQPGESEPSLDGGE
jgi:serine/threonine protein kinase